ncbi:MAG: heme biosynthesis HemY N-terminal domain-containing protein [Pseudomonadota bacterium]
MIRILIFLIGIIFFTYVITLLSNLDSRITGEAFGLHFDGPSGLIIGGLAAVFLGAIYATHKLKDILAIPTKIRAKDAETKRSRGIAALTRGLEAVAAGDGDDAAHHARLARRYLDEASLTRLLTAQAAQLSGDLAAAKQGYAAMLAAPETEFLGLKGLYAQALAADDADAAKGYAERAFRLRPNAEWAFASVFDLGLERGAWRETREAVVQAQKNKVLDAAKANRARAALLTADAYTTASADKAAAQTELDAALKLAPGFTPAAVLAAQIAMEAGKTGRAASILETAFAESSHPALIKLYDRLYKDQPLEKRASKLRKLAGKNSDAHEAALLRARAATLAGEWQAAIDELESLLARAPSAATYALMAQAATGLYGEGAAKIWLEHAANAPRDPRPGAEGEFHLTRQGWARLIRDYMELARLSPPPIEETVVGLSPEELRLLIAPPAEVGDEAQSTQEDLVTQPEASPQEASQEPQSASDEPEEEGSGDAAATEVSEKLDEKSELAEEDDHPHNDTEGARAAAAARNVS